MARASWIEGAVYEKWLETNTRDARTLLVVNIQGAKLGREGGADSED